MAINKKLIHFKTKANFDKELAANNILDTSIVFIQDAKMIWTHGKLYPCPYTKEELDTKFESIEELISSLARGEVIITTNSAVSAEHKWINFATITYTEIRDTVWDQTQASFAISARKASAVVSIDVRIEKGKPIGFITSSISSNIIGYIIKNSDTSYSFKFYAAAGAYQNAAYSCLSKFIGPHATIEFSTVLETLPITYESVIVPEGSYELSNLLAYGVEWDTTISSPELFRIGNPLLHKSLPIQSAFRGCVANKDKIVYYLDPNDWSRKENGEPSVLDGTDGTVRVHTPKFYGKSEEVGNKRRVWISTTLIDYTWDEIPEMLIDAYRCTTHATKGAVSVVNTTAEYRGGNRNTSFDLYLETDKFRTLLGKPATGLSRANMRANAVKAGSEMLSYELYKWIFVWCYVIEYANFNSLAAYTAELTTEGYHKGGLGNGLTTTWNWTHWNNYNSNNPITPCGYGNSIGNGTGLKSITVAANGDNWPTATWQMPRWRGFDNPFGDIWTNLDGIVIDTPKEGASDTSIVPTAYIITDPDKYTDSLEEAKANYTRKYTQPHNQGYIKELNLGINADIVPKTIGGNVTTYMCDYYWVNYDDTPETLLVGGRVAYGGQAGLLFFSSDHGVSHVGAHVGFRTLNRILL